MERGSLNSNVQVVANKMIGRDIEYRELRLYPYIDYCLKNGNELSRSRINDEEVEILEKLENEGHVLYQGGKIYVSKSFYDFLQEVLAVSYVDFEPMDAWLKVRANG